MAKGSRRTVQLGRPAGSRLPRIVKRFPARKHFPFGAGVDEGGGAPEWVPEGAVIHIDLVGGDPQGRAWVDGTGEVDLNTFLDDLYDNFPDISDCLEIDGLIQTEATVQASGALSDLLSDIAAGSTVVLEFVCNDDHEVLLQLDREFSTDFIRFSFEIVTGKLLIQSYITATETHAIIATANAVTLNEVAKVALTYDETKLSASLNGGAVVTVASTANFDSDNIFIGNYDSGDGLHRLRSLSVYTIRPDADLVGLATVS